MNISIFCAAPQSADPRAKVRMKVMSTGLRPKVEARSPTNGTTAVEEMVYALPAHMKSFPWSSPTMVGNAVDTADCRVRPLW